MTMSEKLTKQEHELLERHEIKKMVNRLRADGRHALDPAEQIFLHNMAVVIADERPLYELEKERIRELWAEKIGGRA